MSPHACTLWNGPSVQAFSQVKVTQAQLISPRAIISKATATGQRSQRPNYKKDITFCLYRTFWWKSVKNMSSRLIRLHQRTYIMYSQAHTHTKDLRYTHFERKFNLSHHLSPLICIISRPVSVALGCDKSTGLTRGGGLAVPLITQPLSVTGTQEEEMKISGTARNKHIDWWKGKYDRQVHRNMSWETGKPPILLYPRCCDQDRFWTPSLTFLQALMDDGTALSVLPPSTSIDSEPSNMADDWKLL